MALPEGLYDLLLTEGFASRLDPARADVRDLADGAELLVQALAKQLGDILEDIGGDDADKGKRQLALVNALLVELRDRLRAQAKPGWEEGAVELVASPLRVLKAIKADGRFPVAPGRRQLS